MVFLWVSTKSLIQWRVKSLIQSPYQVCVAYHMVLEDEQQCFLFSIARHGTEMAAFHVQN